MRGLGHLGLGIRREAAISGGGDESFGPPADWTAPSGATLVTSTGDPSALEADPWGSYNLTVGGTQNAIMLTSGGTFGCLFYPQSGACLIRARVRMGGAQPAVSSFLFMHPAFRQALFSLTDGSTLNAQAGLTPSDPVDLGDGWWGLECAGTSDGSGAGIGPQEVSGATLLMYDISIYSLP